MRPVLRINEIINTGGTVSNSYLTVLKLKYKFLIYICNLHSEGCAPRTNAPDKQHRLVEDLQRVSVGVIGSDVPWLDCPACNALTWVITVTE